MRERAAQTQFTKELDSSISKLKQEKEERSMYLTYTSRMMECRRDGYEEGLATGREEGAYQNKLETARSMLFEGLAPAMVARCTDLPLETVLELEKEL